MAANMLAVKTEMTVPVSLTVMELPSKGLLTIDLPREKGDLVTMEEFMPLLEAKLPSDVRLDSIMVGDRTISPYSPLRETARSVRFFLLDSCPWYAHTKPKPTPVPEKLVSLSGPNPVPC